MGRRILERASELAVLRAVTKEAARGAGSVVLVYGEAGIGKSSLVRALRADLPAEGRMLVGYCDDFATPRTLGPFRDLVGSVGGELAAAVEEAGDRDTMLSALRAELARPERPTVLVIEDVHWADDATLDTLRYLVRRVAALPTVLVLTYRDDELSRDHPLLVLLGEASRSDGVRRLPLRRLSEGAVRQLSAGSSVDPGRLFSLTAGNPFFVAEVLASARGDSVPPTILDAVLGRVRRLDAATQDVLEQLAVVPSTLDRWLVDALAPDSLGSLAAAEQRGLLTVSPTRVEFRHELTRRAIADGLPAARRVELNRRVLAALTARQRADPSLLVHHAAAAGDRDAIVRYGPDAARDAARAGAHREAVNHYRLVLQHADQFSHADRAGLLEEYAIECYTLGESHRAAAAQRDAVELRRVLGDPRLLGASLRWLSRFLWWDADGAGAGDAAREAIAMLEDSGDARLLALALSNQSQLDMLANRNAKCIGFGRRAAKLARELGDDEILSHALTNIGMALWATGDPDGQATMDEALRAALGAGSAEDACRAYGNIIWRLLDEFRLDEAERYLLAAQEYAEREEYLGFLAYMRVERARLAFARGAWDQAVDDAELALDAQPPARCAALTVLARIAVRRGDPVAAELLARAWDLAVSIDELQRTGPVAAARAEAAWLDGDQARARAIAAPVYEDATRLGDRPLRSELRYRLIRAGQPVEPDDAGTPYAPQAAGRWREAASAWEAAGCRYEHAAALADSPEPDDLLAALAELDALGAEPLARRLRARLRAMGVARIPRGPVGATRENPAGLTGRQVEVLRLVSAGLTNAEIAGRLVLSVRTVDSHVAAVLDKLDATTRRDAAARAAELGILDG
jgi:ATP/maltotriose-dependent transcriptional regulator MalT